MPTTSTSVSAQPAATLNEQIADRPAQEATKSPLRSALDRYEEAVETGTLSVMKAAEWRKTISDALAAAKALEKKFRVAK